MGVENAITHTPALVSAVDVYTNIIPHLAAH